MALLELRDVHAYYGNIHALKGISLVVEEGEIVTLIGSNGAGKSTTLKTISGLLRPRVGEILFDGQRIDGRRADQVVTLGVTQSPEGRRIFPRMSVRENLEMGAFQRKPGPELTADFERVLTLFPRLRERLPQAGGTLSGGEQQMLSLARVLAAPPRLLIADEMSLGLAPKLVDVVFEGLTQARAEGVTVLLVEQYVERALDFADDAVILSRGRVAWEGPTSDARSELLTEYLGTA